jgi:hypothetical protein
MSADNIYENRRPRPHDHPLKSTANGSIYNLLEKTPVYEQKIKKFSGRLTMGSDIFTPSEPNTKPKKIAVNMTEIKKSKDYAGVKTGRDVEEETKRARYNK